MASDTVQPDTLAKPRQAVSSRQLKNLRNLLLRDNVDFVIVIRGARTLRVGADMGDEEDSKTFSVGADVGGKGENVGDEGCFVLIHLSDNPEGVGVGFFDLAPTSLDSDLASPKVACSE